MTAGPRHSAHHDSEPDLPLDPETPNPPHVRPLAWALVVIGGACGAALRVWTQHSYPTPAGHWPWATFAINMVGSLLLGIILEVLVRLGPDRGWRQNIRLLAATGLCATFTTYSSLALEIVLLLRNRHPDVAVAYGAATVICGAALAWLGIQVAKLGDRAQRAIPT